MKWRYLGWLGLSVLMLELVTGYARFWATTHFPALYSIATKDDATISPNPFINRVRSVGDGYHLHPFIDYTGAQTPAKRWDYFGFRNQHDLYFTKPPPYLVVLTGGSEAAGYSHQRSISERLEALLQEKHPGAKVLNLAMNSYVLANEINAYVQLAFHLKPQVVISLSGWNDIVFGLAVPGQFKALGLNYLKQIETWWLPRLYDLKDHSADEPLAVNEEGRDYLVPHYFDTQRKFSTIVTANSGTLVTVLQASNPILKKRNFDYFKQVSEIYSGLEEDGRSRGFPLIKQNVPVTFTDNIHTDETSAQATAEYFAALVEREKGVALLFPEGKK